MITTIGAPDLYDDDRPEPETATPAAAFAASDNPRLLLPSPRYMSRAARTFALAEVLATCSTWPVSRLDALISRARASRKAPPAETIGATGPFHIEDERAPRLAKLMHLMGTFSAGQLAGWVNTIRAVHWAPGRYKHVFDLDAVPEKSTHTKPRKSVTA